MYYRITHEGLASSRWEVLENGGALFCFPMEEQTKANSDSSYELSPIPKVN